MKVRDLREFDNSALKILFIFRVEGHEILARTAARGSQRVATRLGRSRIKNRISDLELNRFSVVP